MWANEADVMNQMRACGLVLDGVTLRVNTPRPVRFGKSKKMWFWLSEFRTKRGVLLLVGNFGIWGLTDDSGIRVDLSSFFEHLPHADRAKEMAEIKAKQAEAEKKAALRRARLSLTAKDSALVEWRGASGEGVPVHPYVQRKGIVAECTRVDQQNRLIVPMIDYARNELVGVQRIDASGAKRFTAGCAKEGAGVRLGVVSGRFPVILICEGYATACSIRMALDMKVAVFVAFDAGNLLPLARKVRDLYPDAVIVFCADDDYRTRIRGQLFNVGLVKAKKAAKAVGVFMKKKAHVVYPVFTRRVTEKWTDFNDLHCVEGLAEVKKQLGVLCDR